MQQNPVNYDYLFKINVVGDRWVGKTAITTRFATNVFNDDPMICCIGVDFRVRTMNVYGKDIKFQVWDINGSERRLPRGKAYYRRSQGVILTYDVTNRESFLNLKTWLKEFKDLASEDIVVVIVGAKADLEEVRTIAVDEGRDFADEVGHTYIEVSAKSGMNVDELFGVMARKIIEKMQSQEENRNLEDVKKLKQAHTESAKKLSCVG